MDSTDKALRESKKKQALAKIKAIEVLLNQAHVAATQLSSAAAGNPTPSPARDYANSVVTYGGEGVELTKKLLLDGALERLGD